MPRAYTDPDLGVEDMPALPYWMAYQKGGCYEFVSSIPDDGAKWRGMTVPRRFSLCGKAWSLYTYDTYPVFNPETKATTDCIFPTHFSEQSRQIVAAKYLKKCENEDGVPDFRMLVSRVVDTIIKLGKQGGYYAGETDHICHYDELVALLVGQFFAFNSPVWFNLGIPDIAQQSSACFILPVEDSMESIAEWAVNESRIFKRGSGAGADVSRLRSSRENLSLGGKSSGPVSFMHPLDAFAGSIKSGGVTRRAAKMVVMRHHHPDILTNADGTPGFIRCKADAEKQAHALIDAGYPAMFNVPGNAYSRSAFQNANHSVRASDEFMRAAESGYEITTKYVKTGDVCAYYGAGLLLREIAEATWICGDPGMQFDDLINKWNTCAESFYIRASNPCSEYVSRDDTSCNLASLRITKFYNFETKEFDVEGFCSAVRTIILAMEILVGGSDYPTENIAYWTRIYRNLGIGLADLGALLMSMGVPYDSDEGRAIAATISSLMTAQAYHTSHEIAMHCGGAFADYERNHDAMQGVMRMHFKAHNSQSADRRLEAAHYHAGCLWSRCVDFSGFRNANVSVHAPTGTISFLMGCDTTGIEPAISLVSYKSLVGGGTMKLVNGCVEQALTSLSYDPDLRSDILRYVAEHGTIEGSAVSEHDLPVFDCAFPASPGGCTISWKGHVDMLAALQPTISMAISKTVNMPETATVDEIADAYMYAWKKGVKCVAIYRDNCKRSQPLSATLKTDVSEKTPSFSDSPALERRRRLPDTRKALAHKFSIGGHEGYIHVGMYDDGTPGELFVTMSKEGSTVGGLIDAFATSVSLNLQYGVPITKLVDKFKHMRFEPSGWTSNEAVPVATSIVDYIFKWLEVQFCQPALAETVATELPFMTFEVALEKDGKPFPIYHDHLSAPTKVAMTGPECTVCFTMTQPAGKCYVCPACGTTTGCS